MKYTPKHLKKCALRGLTGNWWCALSCYFAYSIISSLLSFFTSFTSQLNSINIFSDITVYVIPILIILLLNLLAAIIISPFHVGFVGCMMDLARFKPTQFIKVFIKTERWPKAMIISFLHSIFEVLIIVYPIYKIFTESKVSGIILVICFLLLLVVTIEFAFLEFVLADNDNISIMNIFIENHRLVKKHRWNIINLIVSFIPWAILCAVTMGIGTPLLKIYYYSALANLYDIIKNDNQLDIIL